MIEASELRIAETPLGRVSYRDTGAGSRILFCMHGLGGNSLTWTEQYRALAGDFRVVGWDAPGYGMTDVVAPEVGAFASLALGLLDHLGIGRVAALGHSMGGIVAQGLAAAAPERVSHVVLSCTYTGNHAPTGTPLSERYAARVAELEREGGVAYGRSRAKVMVGDGAGEAARAKVAEIASHIPVAGLRCASTMLHHADTRSLASKLTMPVMVISGGADKVASAELVDGLAALLPHCRRVHLAELGHAPYIEDPVRYNGLLREFLG